MTGNDIEKEIITIIADLTGYDTSEITMETNIVKDLDVDSIKAIEITVAIEKKYKIKVRDEDVPRIVSVNQAVDLVKKLLV
ncbi:MAG TPA: acyl carrier protein [Nitrospirota bacterium]|nr:acyl carrier protein [Nitrospirota bacterium]